MSFVLLPLEKVACSVPFMYAEDLCVLIDSKKLALLLSEICDCMKTFGLFSGLLLNLGKCGMVINGQLHASDQALVESTRSGEFIMGISICNRVKCLGVMMGNVTSDEAFSLPLAEAQRRASQLAGLQLSLRERLLLLKTWILPTILLTARSYFPSEISIKSLKLVYNTALVLDSRGVTLDHISQEPELGGYQLPTPKV